MLPASATVSKGILTFNSVENYISLIESEDETKKTELIQILDNNSSYFSLKSGAKLGGNWVSNAKALGTKEAEVVETNDFLSTILNSDGMITIGDHFFKIDFEDEKVYVLPVSLEDRLGDLQNKDLSNGDIMVFSTDDDVLDMLADGSKGSANGRTMLFCSDRKANDLKNKEKYYEYSDNIAGVDYRAKIKHGYQKAGVYFSLMTELKHMDRFQSAGNLTPWSASNTEIYLEYYYKYKRRCRSGDNESRSSKYEAWDNKLIRRHYESTRGLARFWIESKYEFLERDVTTGGRFVEYTLETVKDGY